MRGKPMNNKEIIVSFKHKTNMTENEWRCFCSRYAGRDISTVIWCMRILYGAVPQNIAQSLKTEFNCAVQGKCKA